MIDENAKAKLQGILWKRDGYRSLFMDGDKPSPNGLRVLADLRKFCHAAVTTAVMDGKGAIDPIASAQLEGRRQVFIRIMDMCRADDSDIHNMIRNLSHD